MKSCVYIHLTDWWETKFVMVSLTAHMEKMSKIALDVLLTEDSNVGTALPVLEVQKSVMANLTALMPQMRKSVIPAHHCMVAEESDAKHTHHCVLGSRLFVMEFLTRNVQKDMMKRIVMYAQRTGS